MTLQEYLDRKEALHYAVTALSSQKLTAYMARMVKRFGPVFNDLYAIAYETQSPLNCMASHERLIDESFCSERGLKTCDQYVAESLARLKADFPDCRK